MQHLLQQLDDLGIKEPESPQGLKRMSPQNRQFLMYRRNLEHALANNQESEVTRIAKILGLNAPPAEEHCGCPPLPIGEKVISNYREAQIVPQGITYECQTCGHRTTLDGHPDDYSRKQFIARADYPDAWKGPDHEVLPSR